MPVAAVIVIAGLVFDSLVSFGRAVATAVDDLGTHGSWSNVVFYLIVGAAIALAPLIAAWLVWQGFSIAPVAVIVVALWGAQDILRSPDALSFATTAIAIVSAVMAWTPSARAYGRAVREAHRTAASREGRDGRETASGVEGMRSHYRAGLSSSTAGRIAAVMLLGASAVAMLGMLDSFAKPREFAPSAVGASLIVGSAWIVAPLLAVAVGVWRDRRWGRIGAVVALVFYGSALSSSGLHGLIVTLLLLASVVTAWVPAVLDRVRSRAGARDGSRASESSEPD